MQFTLRIEGHRQGGFHKGSFFSHKTQSDGLVYPSSGKILFVEDISLVWKKYRIPENVGIFNHCSLNTQVPLL